MPTRPPGHAFLYKYRPRAPGGLRLQQPREEGNKIFVSADSASPGAERAAASTPGREGQRGHVVRGEAGAGGGGAGLPRGADGWPEWRRVDAGGSPLDRRTGAERRPGATAGTAGAGRPEACKSDFPAGSPEED